MSCDVEKERMVIVTGGVDMTISHDPATCPPVFTRVYIYVLVPEIGAELVPNWAKNVEINRYGYSISWEIL